MKGVMTWIRNVQNAETRYPTVRRSVRRAERQSMPMNRLRAASVQTAVRSLVPEPRSVKSAEQQSVPKLSLPEMSVRNAVTRYPTIRRSVRIAGRQSVPMRLLTEHSAQTAENRLTKTGIRGIIPSIGVSSSGKTKHFDCFTRRFESGHPRIDREGICCFRDPFLFSFHRMELSGSGRGSPFYRWIFGRQSGRMGSEPGNRVFK